MILGAITNIEDLRTWYYGHPNHMHYRLYSGRNSKGATISHTPNDIPDWDKKQGWEKLETDLAMYAPSGGIFTIKIYTGNKNDTRNVFEVTLSLDSKGRNSRINGAQNSFGIAGSGKTADAYIAEQIDTKMQIFKLENEVENLTTQLEEGSTGGVVERLMTQLLSNDRLDQLLDVALFRLGPAKGRGVVMSGIDDSETPESEPTEMTPDQQARFGAAMQTIQNHFPDLVGFMEKLANYIEENPDMAQMIFNKEN